MGNSISTWIQSLELWPLIIALIPNLMFRKFGAQPGVKRSASLIHAIAIFFLTIVVAGLVVKQGWQDWVFFVAVGFTALLLFLIRKKAFPYQRTCPQCEAKLDFQTIYFMDDHLCRECRKEKMAQEEAQELLDEESTPEEDDSSQE
ncbi:MAG: hypothetical protein MI717_13425 [Spirochaetales bacterium]|nr:hypothetical protein [Spirochaetales bacterium]